MDYYYIVPAFGGVAPGFPQSTMGRGLIIRQPRMSLPVKVSYKRTTPSPVSEPPVRSESKMTETTRRARTITMVGDTASTPPDLVTTPLGHQATWAQ